MPEKPCRFLSDAQMSCERYGRKSLAGNREQVNGREPHPHWKVRSLQRSPERDRERRAAGFAAVIVRAANFPGRPHAAAFWANWTMRPSHPLQVLPTRIIVRKLLEKCNERRHARTLLRPTTNVNSPRDFYERKNHAFGAGWTILAATLQLAARRFVGDLEPRSAGKSTASLSRSCCSASGGWRGR